MSKVWSLSNYSTTQENIDANGAQLEDDLCWARHRQPARGNRIRAEFNTLRSALRKAEEERSGWERECDRQAAKIAELQEERDEKENQRVYWIERAQEAARDADRGWKSSAAFESELAESRKRLGKAVGALKGTVTRLQQACSFGALGGKPDTLHLLDWRKQCALGWDALAQQEAPEPGE